MNLASYRFLADLRHHGRTHDGNARRQSYESANGPWRPHPSDRSELTPKAKGRSFDARAAMKPRKAVVGRALRGGNADTATGRDRVQGYRATKAILK